MSLHVALRVGFSAALRRARVPRAHSSPWRLPASRLLATFAHDKYSTQLLHKFAHIFRTSETKLEDIHQHYADLATGIRWSLANDPPELSVVEPPPLYVEHLHAMFDALAASARARDIAVMYTLLKDMPDIFLLQPTPETHAFIISAFLKHQKTPTALSWLKSMASKPGGISPSVEQYHRVLETLSATETPKYLRFVISEMRSAACHPTHETYAILFRAMFAHATGETPPQLIAFQAMFKEMAEQAIPLHRDIVDLIYDEYTARGLPHMGTKVSNAYLQSGDQSLLTPKDEQDLQSTDKITKAFLDGGFEGAVICFEKLKFEGVTGSPHTLKAIIQGSSTIAELKRAEHVTGYRASAMHWRLVALNAVRGDDLSGAVELYHAAKAAGVRPDAPLVSPIIKGLCNENNPKSYATALSLYDELNVAPIVPHVPYVMGVSPKQYSRGPDLHIYECLLRGLGRIAASVPDALALSDRLVGDMKTRGIPLRTVSGATLVIQMKFASTESEALDLYRMSKGDLDQPGYIEVLHAFSSITYGKEFHNPSLPGYFEIANDMKRVGLSALSEKVFSILLSNLNKTIRALKVTEDEESMYAVEGVQASMRRIHDLITLEASLAPSVVLLNTMMDMYNTLECFGDAYRIWEQMSLSGRYDGATISIIFDVCAFGGSQHSLNQVLARLQHEKYEMNKKNWDSLVEAYLRLKMHNQAAKCVCVEMVAKGVPPDQKTVQTLLHYVRRDPVVLKAIRQRVQQFLPELWVELPTRFKKPII